MRWDIYIPAGRTEKINKRDNGRLIWPDPAVQSGFRFRFNVQVRVQVEVVESFGRSFIRSSMIESSDPHIFNSLNPLTSTLPVPFLLHSSSTPDGSATPGIAVADVDPRPVHRPPGITIFPADADAPLAPEAR